MFCTSWLGLEIFRFLTVGVVSAIGEATKSCEGAFLARIALESPTLAVYRCVSVITMKTAVLSKSYHPDSKLLIRAELFSSASQDSVKFVRNV